MTAKPRPRLSKLQVAQDLLVIFLLMALVPSMAWVIIMAPEIPQNVPSYFIAGITVVATIFTSFVKGRVQHGFMRGLEKDLRSICDHPEPAQLPQPSSKPSLWEKLQERLNRQPSQQELLDRRWRGILGIEGITEKLLYTKLFFFIYLLCALLTTAIVTTFTPNPGSNTIDYEPFVPGPLYIYNFTPKSDRCAGQGKAGDDSMLSWNLTNGSYFFARFRRDCPATRVLSHVNNINSNSPDKYAYVDAGVAVERTAMGASALLYRGSAFQQLEEKHGRFLEKTTQCVPVMTSNPVTCKKGGGELRVGDDPRSLYLTLDDDFPANARSRYAEFASRNFTRDSGMVNYLWVVDRNHTVGPGVMIFSAYNDPKGKTLFAKDLARTINDPDQDAGTGGSTTYVVTCMINPLESFEYRLVTLELQAPEKNNSTSESSSAGMAYSRRLSGGEVCTPKEETVGNLHFVAAMTAQKNMVMENYGIDGYFSTVHRVAGEDRDPPYAFNNSRNGLEDALGVIAALGVSNMDLWDDPVVADGDNEKAKAVIEIKRLGGNLLVLFALFPPVFSIAILVYFLWVGFFYNRRPGAGVVYGKQPKFYAAESIRELITLGKPVTERAHVVEHQSLVKNNSPENLEDVRL
ncbi:hypothetical protein EDB81DRAFT_785922 [Dactylonectria macrodidyma]|uniref:Uncharacterized protein n=1 Tax=Dactylonectria macrodidyma TaxID=307937 RepID=A0A9P9F8T2_9HYPO|nr:hypothetical protein EDB81DRAFT_785922 [Dactylonectria macrodidyma]